MTRCPRNGPGDLPSRPAPDARCFRRKWLRAALLVGITAAGVAAVRGEFSRARVAGSAVVDPARLVRGFALPDTRGGLHVLADWADRRAVVLVFLGIECPISNGLAPEMERLAHRYEARGVVFCGVHADPDVRPETAARHAEEYGLTFPILLDADQDVAGQVGVTHTPEAVVLTPGGLVRYRGRIDDRYAQPGKGRAEPSVRDLQDAIEAILAGRTVPRDQTRPIGCPLPRPPRLPGGASITYNQHVAPILDRKCAGCHRPGEVGPFSLLTYADAAKRAQFVHEVAESGRMPPWKPEPGFGTFLDDPRLSARELAVLAAWADAGAPEGDPALRPPAPRYRDGWQLGEPDIVFTMPEAFAVPPGPDIYRAFVIPTPPGLSLPVRAIEFRPGNRRVVHHAKLFSDPTKQSRRRDQADPAPGFASLGSADIGVPALWEWTPGTIPRPPPPGLGSVLNVGADLVLYIHYHPDGKPESDRSQVGLYLSKEPLTHILAGIPLGTTKIDLPAGSRRREVAVSTTLPTDVHAYAVMPHAHFLLREMKVRAVLPDGRVRRLLWIRDWDFNWQGQYQYAEPVPLPKGTRLDLVGIYDNSDANPRNPFRPARRVLFGPTSTDEMLGCHIQVIPDRPEDYSTLRKKWPAGL